VTLLDTPTEIRSAPRVEDAPESSSSKEARAAALERTSRIAIAALVVIAISAGVFALLDGPVADAWYRTRDHQLAAQWSATRPHVGAGNTVALLQVPRLRLNLPVAEGDAPQQLRSGPGHRIGTPAPGAVGNSVIVGHGAAWGGPLGQLGTLKRGDLIAVQTESSSGPIGVFTVQSVRAVSGDDRGPFARSTDRRITIVAGTGGRYSDRRIAVTAVSGTLGRVLAPGADVYAITSGGSPIFNADVGLLVLAFLVAALAVWQLRRRYRRSTVAIVVVPFVVLAMVPLWLNVDALMPTLR